MQPKIIIGFVGKLCAGKGFAISYLVEKHGFISSSCSDRIREEIRKNGDEVTRERLQETGGKLRQEFGPSVLAKKTIDDLSQKGVEKAVVDSIRATEEVELLKTIPNFYLIAVNADTKLRFDRMIARKRGESDPITFEEFQKTEERDLKGDGRDIEGCINMADFQIQNNGTEEELYQKLEEVLQKIGYQDS